MLEILLLLRDFADTLYFYVGLENKKRVDPNKNKETRPVNLRSYSK